jgi:hypothetical protein
MRQHNTNDDNDNVNDVRRQRAAAARETMARCPTATTLPLAMYVTNAYWVRLGIQHAKNRKTDLNDDECCLACSTNDRRYRDDPAFGRTVGSVHSITKRPSQTNLTA